MSSLLVPAGGHDLAGLPRAFPGVHRGSDLVPGVPARVLELAAQLQTMAEGMAAAQRALGGQSLHSWRGRAALAFTALLASLPHPYGQAARAFAASAAAVEAHARVLAMAQAAADEAVALDLRATALTKAPGSGGGGVVSPVIAAALQRQAVADVQQARARVRASAAAAAGQLRSAARLAPKEPNVVLRLLQSALSGYGEVNIAVQQTAVGIVTAGALYGPTRLVGDPSGWGRDTAAALEGAASTVRHPRATLTALEDTAEQNPARLVGDVGVALAGAGAAGGAVKAANLGASLGVRVVTAAARGTAQADLRAAMATARATSRSRMYLWDFRDGWRGHDAGLSPGQHLVTAGLAKDARWARHDLLERLRRVGAGTGTELVDTATATKKRGTIFGKIKRSTEDGESFAEASSGMNDTVRFTLLAGGSSYVGKVGPIIRGLQDDGMLLVARKNFWGSDRYRGVNLTFADPRTGRLLEVQVHTPQSHAASKATHDDYGKMREVETSPAEKERLRRKIAAVFAKVPAPDGLEHLDDHLGSHAKVHATNTVPMLTSPHPVAVGAGGAVSGGAALSSTSSVDDHRR